MNQPQNQSKSVRRWLLLTLGAVVLVAIVFFIWYFLNGKSIALKPEISPANSPNNAANGSIVVDPSVSAPTKTSPTDSVINDQTPTSTETTVPVAPTVSTESASNITAWHATMNGKITSFGSTPVTQYGIMFYGAVSTCSQNVPAYFYEKNLDSSTGNFSSTISYDIPQRTATYSYATFAINAAGFASGKCVHFTMPGAISSPSSSPVNLEVYFGTQSTQTVDIPHYSVGESVGLVWHTDGAVSCYASGDWSGSKALMGTQSTGTFAVAKTYTYTLTCSNASGNTKSKTATVRVTEG